MYQQVYQIYQNHRNDRGKSRTDGGEKEGVQLKKHIIRVDERKVNHVGEEGYHKRGNGG
jgi:hypothetical protein